MRRRRVEMQIGRLLQIGQQWRRRDDGTVWTVAQVHRKDCVAELSSAGQRDFVSFECLRSDWRLIAHLDARQQEAA